jgi:serine/threonine protein kinase
MTIAAMLLASGAIVDSRDRHLNTALFQVAINNDIKLAEILLENGADPNVQNNNGSTPLHFACINSSQDVVKCLLEKGANIEIQNEEGNTAVHTAALHNHQDVATLLINERADTNIKNKEGKTPIHIALGLGFTDFVRSIQNTIDEMERALLKERLDLEEQELSRLEAERQKDIREKEDHEERIRQRKIDEKISKRNQVVLAVRMALELGEPISVSFDLIAMWTQNFSKLETESTFCTIYRGLVYFPDEQTLPTIGIQRLSSVEQEKGRYVSVKKISGGFQCQQKIQIEIAILSEVNHENILRLIAHCIPSVEQVAQSVGDVDSYLVYEIAERGSLSDNIVDDKKACDFPWFMRLRVALGIVDGLSYMNSTDYKAPVLHGDLRSSSVFITSIFHAKVGGYQQDREQSFVSSEYTCPRLVAHPTMKYDVKCEIYSFGILLLEILTGRLNSSEANLALEEAIIPDARAGGWPERCLAELTALARECVADYERRFSDFGSILSKLREINRSYTENCPEVISLESKLELLMQINELQLQKDIAKRNKEEARFECILCGDSFKHSRGYLCPNARCRKFLCSEDFNEMILSQCNDNFKFVRHGCNIVCAYCLALPVSEGEPRVETQIDIADLQAHADRNAIAQFLNASRIATDHLAELRKSALLSREREKHATEMQVIVNNSFFVL